VCWNCKVLCGNHPIAMGRSLACPKVFALVKGDTTCVTSRAAGARVREGPVAASLREYTRHSVHSARDSMQGCGGRGLCVCVRGIELRG
jgi:hypothetical protein